MVGDYINFDKSDQNGYIFSECPSLPQTPETERERIGCATGPVLYGWSHLKK
jgi:hypothetical protein